MKIREYRRKKGLTQSQLADLIGVKTPVVSKYETGSVTPPSDRLVKIAEALDVNPSMLLEISDSDHEDSALKRINAYARFFKPEGLENDHDPKTITSRSYGVNADFYQIYKIPVDQSIWDYSSGCCELCGQDAPFCLPDGRPYLEMHLVTWASDGGDAVPDNIVFLCSNCHKKIHYLKDPHDVDVIRKAALKHTSNINR